MSVPPEILLLACVLVLLGTAALIVFRRPPKVKLTERRSSLPLASDSDPAAEDSPPFDIPLPTLTQGDRIEHGTLLARWMNAHQACPVCRAHGKFMAGPRGGMAQNFRCSGCGSTFNNIGPFGVDVLSVYYPRRTASG